MAGPVPGRGYEPPKPTVFDKAKTAWVPETDADRKTVLNQLERILGNRHFSTGSRGPALLRYIVENALAGHLDLLKERTLGIEVFGREPSYDTNLDPVVRVTASRVRQKLAQYYAEADPEGEIRISLPSGSYVPMFHAPDTAPAIFTAAAERTDELMESPAEHPVAPRARKRSAKWVAYLCIASLAVLAAVGVQLARRSDSDLALFWAPVLKSPEPVLVCLGTGLTPAQRESLKPDSTLTISEKRNADVVSWADAQTMSRVTTLLTQQGKAFQIQKDDYTSLRVLRTGPAVLIGAFNNEWVIRLMQQGRYRFERDVPAHAIRIVDSQHPERADWKIVTDASFSEFKEDYGMVARVLDATTERTVIVAAGLGSYGTLAAGELATTPKYLAALAARDSGWQKRNLQAVIKTRVLGGNSGPPEIVATHFW